MILAFKETIKQLEDNKNILEIEIEKIKNYYSEQEK